MVINFVMHLLLVCNIITLACSMPLLGATKDMAIGLRAEHMSSEEASRGTKLFRCGHGVLENHHPLDPITETPGNNGAECRYTPSTLDVANIKGCHCMFFR